VLAGTQISTPPIGILLIVAGIYAGHLLMHGSLPAMPDLHSTRAIWQLLARPMLIDWLVGGPIVGIVLGVMTFLLANRFYHGVEDDLEAEVAGKPVEVVRRRRAS